MTGLALEFVLLFIVLPTLFAYTRHKLAALPGLWALTLYCLWVLLRDSRFPVTRFWEAAVFPVFAPRILALFAIVTAIGSLLVRRFAPRELFFAFPRARPWQWAALMVLYPVLSVYPQGIVYRAFIFERYRDLFGAGWAMLLASTIAFAYAHIIYRNRLALALTTLGGVLFAFRYQQTGSLFVSSFEHALYGCAIFTLGIGQWFHHAHVTAAKRPPPASNMKV